MIIIGCDFHPSYQQVAMLNTETGRIEHHRLMHATGELSASTESCLHPPWWVSKRRTIHSYQSRSCPQRRP
jgi:hypothetical protein